MATDVECLCPYCGKEYEGRPYFCNYCGKPLFTGAGKVEVSEDTVIENQQTVVKQNEADDNVKTILPVGTTSRGNKSTTSRYSQTKRLMMESDIDEQQSHEPEKKSSKWFAISLIWFFVMVIIAGIVLFFMYDKKFDERRSEKQRLATDSINADIQAKLDKIKRERDVVDSIRNSEFAQISFEDSVERAKRDAEWKEDSMLVDKNMSDYIHNLSSSNMILGKYFDYETCVCYYTDTIKPIFKLTCYDGKKEEIGDVVIDNIQGQLSGFFTTPNGKSLIVLCKDTVHDYAMAYRVNMKENTILDYPSMDEQGNRCFDISSNDDGFYMKFGKGDNKSFVNLYTSYFDKYGNFINKK